MTTQERLLSLDRVYPGRLLAEQERQRWLWFRGQQEQRQWLCEQAENRQRLYDQIEDRMRLRELAQQARPFERDPLLRRLDELGELG